MNIGLMFSSETDNWATPQEFFNKYNKLWNFTHLALFASAQTSSVKYYSVIENGLFQKWEGICWMNPPYGRGINAWMRKAYESSLEGAIVVCLVPARTDTAWWHDYAMKGHIEFLRGRLKFGNAKNSAPFPSAVVTFIPKGFA